MSKVDFLRGADLAVCDAETKCAELIRGLFDIKNGELIKLATELRDNLSLVGWLLYQQRWVIEHGANDVGEIEVKRIKKGRYYFLNDVEGGANERD